PFFLLWDWSLGGEVDVFEEGVVIEGCRWCEETCDLHLFVGEIFEHVDLAFWEEDCASGFNGLDLAVDEDPPVTVEDVDDLLAGGVRVGRADTAAWRNLDDCQTAILRPAILLSEDPAEFPSGQVMFFYGRFIDDGQRHREFSRI